METEKYYFRVGVFCLAITAVFVYYLMSFGSGLEGQNLTRYAVYFEDSISGLTRGAPVKLKGIAVGLVDKIEFAGSEDDKVLVWLEVNANAPIREDTVASIDFQGITGATYLSLENSQPGTSVPLLKTKAGEKYPVIKSVRSEFQAVISNAPEVLGDISKTAKQAQKLLSDKNILAVQGVISETHNVLTEATGTLREIKMMARTLREDPSVILRGGNYEGYRVAP